MMPVFALCMLFVEGTTTYVFTSVRQALSEQHNKQDWPGSHSGAFQSQLQLIRGSQGRTGGKRLEAEARFKTIIGVPG